jgi:Ca2+-binding RTX toxin-like protein
MGKPERTDGAEHPERAVRRAAPVVALTIALAGAAPVFGQTPQPTCFGLAATIVGTEGNDADAGALRGTPGDDVIVGLGGQDEIDGFGGNDRICGDAGGDIVNGSSGDDMIDGGPDLDLVEGSAGNDTLVGGDGVDLATFLDARQRIEASLLTGTAVGDGADTMTGFEGLAGSQLNDLLIGNDEQNYFFGLDGNDVVRGADGFDSMLFLLSVTVDLANRSATGREHSDTLESIEGLAGSNENDVLLGDAADNFFSANDGRDVVSGRAGDDRLLGGDGNDELNGGAGNDTLSGEEHNDRLDGGPGAEDTASYVRSQAAISADLASGRILGEGVDNARRVEVVSGSDLADRLAGDARANSLYGNGGTDRLLGRGGPDFLNGGSGRDSADGGKGTDYCVENERIQRCEPPSRRSFSSGATGRPMRAWSVAGPPLAGFRVGSTRRAVGKSLRALRAQLGCRGGCTLQARRRRAARLAPGFLRSLLPLATLRRLATRPEDAVHYTGGTAPTCFSRRGQHVIRIAPPEQVKPLSAQDEKVIWNATLRRYTGSGAATIVKVAPTAEARIEAGLTQEGWPEWEQGKYEPVVTVVPRGRYAWTARVTWDYSGAPLPMRRVRPHKQAGRSSDSCTFR